MSNFMRSFYEKCNKIMDKNCSIGEKFYKKVLFENRRVKIELVSNIMEMENQSPKLFINTLFVEDPRSSDTFLMIFYGHHTVGGGNTIYNTVRVEFKRIKTTYGTLMKSKAEVRESLLESSKNDIKIRPLNDHVVKFLVELTGLDESELIFVLFN